MNRRQAARILVEESKARSKWEHKVYLKEGDVLSIMVDGKHLGAAKVSNSFLVLIPWGKYRVGEYSDETFHPGTAVDCLEVEPDRKEVKGG